MTATYATFVAAFPEFSNATTYPQAGVNFWIAQGYIQLNARRFGTSLDLAVMLFTAHNVVLGAQAAATATGTGIVGSASGPLQSKSVGPVSASYDASIVATEGAGIYNATSYGQRLLQLIRAYCGGPVYVPARRRFGYGGYGTGYGGPWNGYGL